MINDNENGKDSKGCLEVFLGAIGFGLFIVLICFVCSSCKLFREVNKSSKDSTSVNNTKEGSIKFDSSGSKSDITNTKETIYYPQPIIVPGKDGESRIIIVPQSVKESGTEKTEQAHIITDTSWKDAIREMTVALSKKETETSAKPDWLTIAMVIGVALLVLKSYLGSFISIRKPL